MKRRAVFYAGINGTAVDKLKKTHFNWASMTSEPMILASASPRRQELLQAAGVDFEVAVSEASELSAMSGDEPTPVELALANARRKVAAVARKNPGRWILGADTVVALDGTIFGKPRLPWEARGFLRALSGRTHEVVTGCVLRKPDDREDQVFDLTRVTFRVLSEEDISRYLAAVNVFDKAGAYALQENGDWVVESVAGSRTNVIGLPMEKLGVFLRTHGLME